MCDHCVQSFQSAVHIHEFHDSRYSFDKFQNKYCRFKFLVPAFICSSSILSPALSGVVLTGKTETLWEPEQLLTGW